MITLKCDICKKELQTPSLAVGNFHFCERDAPFSEEYIREVTRITVESTHAYIKAVDRFRNKFMQDKVRSPLKVVADAG